MLPTEGFAAGNAVEIIEQRYGLRACFRIDRCLCRYLRANIEKKKQADQQCEQVAGSLFHGIRDGGKEGYD
jgi:hypothetical protein